MKRTKSLTYWIVLMLVVGLIGTGPGPVLAEEYQVIDVTDGGTITGVAIWKGEIPAIPPISVSLNSDVCGETAPSPVLQVDLETHGVRSVLVYLEKVDKGKAPAEKYWLHMGKDDSNKVPFTQVCQFKEHVFAFVRRSRVAMINFDRILHIVLFFNEKHDTVFNAAMPTQNREVEHTLLRDHGVGLPFQCDLHENMNGYAFGFDHPYFARTDADGKFEIIGVPPGAYTLVAWHEGYKSVRMNNEMRPIYDRPHVIRKEIEVKPRGMVAERFEFPVY